MQLFFKLKKDFLSYREIAFSQTSHLLQAPFFCLYKLRKIRD